jgi:ATP-dependent DNA helicase RecG
MEQSLVDAGFTSPADLLSLIPRGYDDFRTVLSVEQAIAAPEGERVTVKGTVLSARIVPAGRRFLEVALSDGPGGGGSGSKIHARWFNVYGSMLRRFVAGSAVVLSGKLRRDRKGLPALANPDVGAASDDGGLPFGDALRPRYPDVPGVRPGALRTMVRAALELALADPELDHRDVLPPALRQRQKLPGLAETLSLLHAPPADVAAEDLKRLNERKTPAHARSAVADLFVLQLAVLRRRMRARQSPAPMCAVDEARVKRIAAGFSFTLTGAQKRAIREIAADLAGDAPMQRLLQGDVGSGKTAVAFAACAAVGLAGRQAALMAPTELLANQHHQTVAPWCERLGLRAALLTASTPRAVRETTLALAEAGRIDLLTGTHALLAERVAFADLGLAVIDEQHRFGVAQRARLRGKAATTPHLLVMTATPIPRTLALTAYGDLDLSLIDERPPGRIVPETRLLLGEAGRERAHGHLRRALGTGKARVFVVCPLVEESEKLGVSDATRTAEQLTKALPGHGVGLVHGRLPAAERDAVMASFRDGLIEVLVATTVIEVGVDVPDANIMLVEHAERFGLAQLHQLRGRIGRGGGASLCLLHAAAAPASDSARRLEVLTHTHDGFVVAEADLRERGPGELWGTRQSGLDTLRTGDLALEVQLIVKARAEAEEVLARDPDLALPEHAAARRALLLRYPDEGTSSVGVDAG